MVFFQLNVTGLLFQSFRTASPLCINSSVSEISFLPPPFPYADLLTPIE